MIEHEVRTHPSSAALPREEQLAWRLAAMAIDPVEVTGPVTEMIINRIIDDAAVAAAALARGPVRAAREQALRHPIFVAARLPGWTAHIAEQIAVNSLIRPLAVYDGPAERHLAQKG